MGESREPELWRYLQSQRELSTRLIADDSLDDAAPVFLSTVAGLLRWEAGALWEAVEGAPALRFVCGWSMSDLDAEPLWHLSREQSFERGTGLPGRAWGEGAIVWAPDFSENDGYPRRSTAAALGLKAALAMPIPIGSPGAVLAVAEFHTSSFNPQSEELMALLGGFADQLAAFIASRRAESRIEAGEEFKAAVLGASLDCIIGMDADGTVLEFNEAAERLFGFRREEAVGRELAELIVPEELRERHRAGLRRYRETGEGTVIDSRVELSALRKDGSVIPVELTVTRIRGSDPPVFTGFLRDISDRAEAERVRQHLAEVVRGTQDAVLSKDLDGIVTSWNQAAERLYGYSAEEAVGRHISFLIPPDHRGEEQVILDRVRRGERLETYETERIRADGARISVSLTVSPISSPPRGLIGASVVARDITAEVRRRNAREFLIAASRLLDSSLDPVETARTIAATAIPELARFCVVDFLREDGWLGESIVAGADPKAAERLEEIRRRSPLDPEGEHPVAQAVRAGRPMIWHDLRRPEVAEKVAQNEEHRRLMEEANYNSAAVVPLVARGRTLGAISFLHTHPDLRYDPGDLEFLGELGERAAMALDNARLFRERDQIAQNLQRGLRPPSPAEVPGLEISVVFEAAGEGVEIGGDFYDVLPAEDGCWILLGDVAGKGSAAAAVSVAVRHSVWGLTREIAEPEEVLLRVNELLIEGRSLNDFATAILLRLRREEDSWRLALAAAGHPPAIHVTEDGAVQLGGGTILGAWSDSSAQRHDATLHSGESLVLCTDGWLEVGSRDAHRDPDAFAAEVRSLSHLDPEELTGRLRADAVERGGGTLRDDMVILAVRPVAGADSSAAAAVSPEIMRNP